MARDHARIYTRIWNDPEFRKLDQASQHVYLMLVSAPRLTYCGVIDYLPSRLAAQTAGLTDAKIRTAVRTLERTRYVVVDRETHELVVRSYIRWDGVLGRRNMGFAVARALGLVVSQVVREAILTELARLWADDKTLAGWQGFSDFDPVVFDMACAIACGMEWPEDSA